MFCELESRNERNECISKTNGVVNLHQKMVRVHYFSVTNIWYYVLNLSLVLNKFEFRKTP